MSVSRDIVATWRRPRTVMRSLLAQGRREDRALMFLILACGIIFVSQWPVISRGGARSPLQARLAITFFAWLMQALWLMFALVIVLSLLIRELVGLVTDLPTGGPIMGPMQDSSLILGLVMAGFLYLTIHAVHRIGGSSAAPAVSRKRRFWSSGCSSS
jgi:hypothetical protein